MQNIYYELNITITSFAVFRLEHNRPTHLYAYKGILNQPPFMNKVYTKCFNERLFTKYDVKKFQILAFVGFSQKIVCPCKRKRKKIKSG